MTQADEAYSSGAATRSALIEVGILMFGRRGFHPTSTRALAEAAGVNQALIGFHFGGKEGLYLAVCHHIAEQLYPRLIPPDVNIERLEAIKDPSEADAACLEAICRMTDCMLDVMSDPKLKPWLCIVMQEQLEPGSAFDYVYDRLVGPHFDMFAKLISHLRPDHSETENKLVAAMVIGQVLAFHPARSAILKNMNWASFGEEEIAMIKAASRRNIVLLMQHSAARTGA